MTPPAPRARPIVLLERAGYDVRVAGDGEEGLTALAAQAFDHVLLDVRLPRPDGLEVTCRLRALEGDSGLHIPVIAVTANAFSDERAMFRRGSGRFCE